MNRINSEYFKQFLDALVSDFKKYNLTDVVGKGIALSTAQKIRRTTDVDELYKTKTKTIIILSKTVDELNSEHNEVDAQKFEEVFKKDFKYVVDTAQEMFEQKRMKASKIATVSATQIRKLKNQGTESNYYLETIGEIADYIQKTELTEKVSDIQQKESELVKRGVEVEKKKRKLEKELKEIDEEKSSLEKDRLILEDQIKKFDLEKQKQAKEQIKEDD